MRPRRLRPPTPLLASRTAVVALAVGALFSLASPASAHADFVSSNPADGTVLDEPPELVEVVFTAPVQPARQGIRVLDENRAAVEVTVFQPSDEIIAALFDEELSDGRYVVFFSLISEDGHEVEGSFAFDVGAAIGATATTDAPGVTATTVPTNQMPEVTDENDGWDLVGGIGRWMAIVGAVLAVGAFAFASTALIGTQAEVRQSVRWIRIGGALVIIGTLVEVAAIVSVQGDFPGSLTPHSIFTTVSTTHLVAVVLRLVGGVALLQSPAAAMLTTVTGSDPVRYRLAGRQDWLTLAGMATVLASFAFDGHTPTAGAVARIASIVHVGAAGVWVGGVWTMLDVVRRRRREGRSTDTAPMALRFSRIAAWALGTVFLAGVALALSIAHQPSDLVSGSWGRVLILKTILVATAAAIGVYNHFRVVPKLNTQGADMRAMFQRMLTAESILFVGVTILAAILVVAST